MKNLIVAVALVAGVVGCTKSQATTAVNAVFSAADVACIIANATLDVPAVTTACALAPALQSEIQKIIDSELSARRAAVAKAARGE